MRFDMVSPCDNCPFRRDGKGIPLQAGHVAEIRRTLVQQQGTFPCHKTVDYSGDSDGDATGPNVQHCAGALITLEGLGRPNQMMRWMERLGFYDRNKLDSSTPCGFPEAKRGA